MSRSKRAKKGKQNVDAQKTQPGSRRLIATLLSRLRRTSGWASVKVYEATSRDFATANPVKPHPHPSSKMFLFKSMCSLCRHHSARNIPPWLVEIWTQINVKMHCKRFSVVKRTQAQAAANFQRTLLETYEDLSSTARQAQKSQTMSEMYAIGLSICLATISLKAVASLLQFWRVTSSFEKYNTRKLHKT